MCQQKETVTDTCEFRMHWLSNKKPYQGANSLLRYLVDA